VSLDLGASQRQSQLLYADELASEARSDLFDEPAKGSVTPVLWNGRNPEPNEEGLHHAPSSEDRFGWS
jgi:hypothetical protein